MRITLATLSFLLLLVSCARMPYEQWNGKLTNEESVLNTQSERAEVLAEPDLRLFNGVINATKDNTAEPYPRLSSLAHSITETEKKIIQESDSALQKLEKFRLKYGTKSISNVGPEFSDFDQVLSTLHVQVGMNQKSLDNLASSDQLFDSLCQAFKIRAVSMLDHEVLFSEQMNNLEDRFVSASNNYEALKRQVTKQSDPKASMTKLNGMKQKVRQLESELLQYSNLYSRVSSFRADAIIYQGPYIDSMTEIALIKEKGDKISAILDEFEQMITDY